jgi:hypothetical protein
VLLGSVQSNLSFGFDSGSKNQTQFWSKLVPFFNVSKRRVNKLECWLRCYVAVDGNARCVRILRVVAMAAEGHRCDT